jgi:hypothetical protein
MKFIAFFILFSILSITSFSQVKDTTDRRMVSVGALLANDIFIFQLDYSISIKNNFYKLGYICDGGLSLTGEDGPSYKGSFLQSVSFTFGDRFRSKAFEAWLYCGPAYVWGINKFEDNPQKQSNTIGLEAKALLMFRASKSAGFGVGCFGNLNRIKSFVGATISIVITNGN